MQRALAIVAVVGAGGAAGFLSYHLEARRLSPPVPLSAEQPGAREPDEEHGTQAPSAPIPDVLPDVALPDLSGQPRSLRSFGARPLIVNFWATWCAPCRNEIPLLRELRRRYRADGLEVIGIAVDFPDAVQSYLRQTPIDYPLLIGEQGGLEAAQRFGMGSALPFSVFVDARGRIVALKLGELHADEADFILGEVRALDHGQIDMRGARARIEAGLRELAVRRAQTQQNRG